MRDYFLQCSVQRGKAIAQKQTQVDTLGAIVELAFVNGQAWSFCKRFRKAVLVEQVLKIILNPLRKRFLTRLVSTQAINLRQGFHNETGMIVVDKVSYSINSVKP